MWSQAQAYCITCLYLTKQSEFKNAWTYGNEIIWVIGNIVKSVRAGASLHGSYAKGLPPKLLAKCRFFISDLAGSMALPKMRWCLHSFCLPHPTILFQEDYSVKCTKHAQKQQKVRENCNLQGVVLSIYTIFVCFVSHVACFVPVFEWNRPFFRSIGSCWNTPWTCWWSWACRGRTSTGNASKTSSWTTPGSSTRILEQIHIYHMYYKQYSAQIYTWYDQYTYIVLCFYCVRGWIQAVHLAEPMLRLLEEGGEEDPGGED